MLVGMWRERPAVERRGLRWRGAPAVPNGMREDAREEGKATRAVGCGRVEEVGGLGGVVGGVEGGMGVGKKG